MRNLQSMRSWYGDQRERARRASDLWNLRHPVGSPLRVFCPDGSILFTRVKAGAAEMAEAASLFVDELGIWMPLRRVTACDLRHRALIVLHQTGCCPGCGEEFRDTAAIAWRGSTPILRCSCGHVEVGRC